MRRLVIGLLLAAMPAAVVPLSAQEAGSYRLRVQIQPDRGITEQQAVRLYIEVEGQGSPQLSVSGLNDLTNLKVVGGPERLFNSTWSPGRQSSTTQLAYTLLPLGKGEALIPSLEVDVDGKKVRSQPIRFQVAAAPAGQPPPAGRERGDRSSDSDQADVFLQMQLGSEQVWVGQAVPLSVVLYRGAERVTGPEFVAEPSLSSFWVEDIEVDPDGEATRATVQGRPYVAHPLRRQVLVPQTAGQIEIEPYAVQVQVQLRSNDPFESLLSLGRRRAIVRRSRARTLDVRPLPTAGRPEDFGGAVGEFEFQVRLDRDEATVNEAVALTATVEGEGFLRAVSPPKLELPPDVKRFDPKVTSSSRTVRGRLVSRKSWEWILVPLVAGALEVPTLRFPYFDTKEGAYKVAEQEIEPLVVRQSGELPEAAVARGDIQLKRRDLAFIKPLRGSLSYASERVHQRPLYLLLLLSPLAWAPAWVLLGRRRAKLQQNLGLARSRRARSRARQRLRGAEKHMGDAASTRFHEDVARALVEYVADRFDRSAAGMTYQLADELLATRGLDEELRRRFRACLESCDFALYVPASSGSERRAEVLGEAQALVEEIEKAW